MDRCTVLIWDRAQDAYEVLASRCQLSSRGAQPVETGLRVAASEFPLLHLVCRERRPHWVEDVDTGDLCQPNIVKRYGTQAILACRSLCRTRVLGVLGGEMRWMGLHSFSNARKSRWCVV